MTPALGLGLIDRFDPMVLAKTTTFDDNRVRRMNWKWDPRMEAGAKCLLDLHLVERANPVRVSMQWFYEGSNPNTISFVNPDSCKENRAPIFKIMNSDRTSFEINGALAKQPTNAIGLVMFGFQGWFGCNDDLERHFRSERSQPHIGCDLSETAWRRKDDGSVGTDILQRLCSVMYQIGSDNGTLMRMPENGQNDIFETIEFDHDASTIRVKTSMPLAIGVDSEVERVTERSPLYSDARMERVYAVATRMVRTKNRMW